MFLKYIPFSVDPIIFPSVHILYEHHGVFYSDFLWLKLFE